MTRTASRITAAAAAALAAIVLVHRWDAAAGHDSREVRAAVTAHGPAHTYLGFDRNEYPGDAALDSLRRTFAFSGYWLNAPPGAKTNTWQSKRGVLRAHGFGFLVLFNGRFDKELKSASRARVLGVRDAGAAVKAAKREGFPRATIIFLDQEEGGRMLSEQRAYLYAWIDGVNAAGYRAGVYCSGIPVRESAGVEITTASDIQSNARGRKIEFFVYNDACPPSPGCDFKSEPAPPSRSGVASATAWQFAQSPQRREFTSSCSKKYDPNGNCYAPIDAGKQRVFVDVDAAKSPDPSNGR